MSIITPASRREAAGHALRARLRGTPVRELRGSARLMYEMLTIAELEEMALVARHGRRRG